MSRAAACSELQRGAHTNERSDGGSGSRVPSIEKARGLSRSTGTLGLVHRPVGPQRRPPAEPRRLPGRPLSVTAPRGRRGGLRDPGEVRAGRDEGADHVVEVLPAGLLGAPGPPSSATQRQPLRTHSCGANTEKNRWARPSLLTNVPAVSAKVPAGSSSVGPARVVRLARWSITTSVPQRSSSSSTVGAGRAGTGRSRAPPAPRPRRPARARRAPRAVGRRAASRPTLFASGTASDTARPGAERPDHRRGGLEHRLAAEPGAAHHQRASGRPQRLRHATDEVETYVRRGGGLLISGWAAKLMNKFPVSCGCNL